MNRMIIMAGAGLLLGITAGVGGRFATRPDALAPAAHEDVAAADTAAASDAPATEHGSQTAAPDSSAHAAAHETSADSAHARSSITTVAEIVPLPPPTPLAPATTSPQQPPESAKRLARIFSAMKPAEAAAVLQQMDDTDVRDVIFGMNERVAGAILAHFEPARAAELSRGALRKAGT